MLHSDGVCECTGTKRNKRNKISIKAKIQRETANEVKRGVIPGEVSPLQVYLSWESELWVIRIHWNSTSEHQCSSSAKPVNSGMSDSFYTACTGHGVCQTDLSLHLQWSWSPAPRPSHASNLSQRHPSLLRSKWREQNLLRYFREDKRITNAPCWWICWLLGYLSMHKFESRFCWSQTQRLLVFGFTVISFSIIFPLFHLADALSRVICWFGWSSLPELYHLSLCTKLAVM